MTKRKTNEEFRIEMSLLNSNIEILGEYKSAHTKINCRCLIHNIEWEITPHSLLKGAKCPECVKESQRFRQTLTHCLFVEKMNLINKNIVFNSRYGDSKTSIKCKCLIDGYEWEPLPNDLLSGSGCPKCAGVVHKTHNDFAKEVYELNKNIIVLGKYINARTKILYKCKIDDCEWESTPNDVLNGSGCPKCAKKYRRNHNEFIKELYNINPNIIVIDTFINTKTKILCSCKIDNNQWMALPETLLKGIGCPECNKSKGEKRISQYFLLNKINFKSQKPFCDLVGINNGLLSYDFYLPEHNILIEYQGEMHERYVKGIHKSKKDFEKQLEHDRRKCEYADKNNIKLLEIWYWDFDNIEKILEKEI